jgi:hypothetical protein
MNSVIYLSPSQKEMQPLSKMVFITIIMAC